MIVLEDLHWADTNSVELLRQVAGGIVDSHLLLIATLRALPGEPGDAVREFSRLDSVHAMPLRPLTADAIREYLTALDPAGSSAARAEEVARRSGGLPLLLDAAASDTGTPGTVAVRDLVEALLAQLPKPARRVVQVAALLRPPVDTELVGQVAEVDGSTAGLALDAACRAGLLTRTTSWTGIEGQGLEFTHGLLAEGLGAFSTRSSGARSTGGPPSRCRRDRRRFPGSPPRSLVTGAGPAAVRRPGAAVADQSRLSARSARRRGRGDGRRRDAGGPQRPPAGELASVARCGSPGRVGRQVRRRAVGQPRGPPAGLACRRRAVSRHELRLRRPPGHAARGRRRAPG
ncbi:hypothetical protein [Pseudofrankia sp. BMG5.36]|uniref:hypothetical protein n=1 Tax=Pseudofrankia sp. BMG5.36 TaxID=1834512 RepID=UPI001F518ABB|nr:hypothetical protein [Pseudofrankia sp. BMG5.36]